MGSSISVLVAEALSLIFAERVLRRIKSTLGTGEGKANAFVDDIFVSWKLGMRSDLHEETTESSRGLISAALEVAREQQVTLKFVHCAFAHNRGR